MIFDYVTLIIKGVIIGFFASAPPGPVAVICIQRTLNKNRNTGFISGLGAATADTIFALLAAFALAYVNSFIEDKKFWLQAIAGIIVMVVGFSIYTKRIQRPNRTSADGNYSFTSNYLSTFFLTVTNPMYFFALVGLFAVLGVAGDIEGSLIAKMALVLGVFVGAAAWWLLLSWGVDKIRNKFTIRTLWWLNKISGGVIIALGAFAIIQMLLEITKIIH